MQDSMQYAYGAGNDLARCLNWGGGLAALREQGLPAALAQIEQATPSLLDRWQVAIQPRPPQPISDPSQRHKRTRSLQQRAESAIHSIQPQPKVSFLPESLHRSFALLLNSNIIVLQNQKLNVRSRVPGLKIAYVAQPHAFGFCPTPFFRL